MFTNEQALSASRAIRPLLPKLIPAQADQIDQQLAQLLNQTDLDETTQVDQLLDVLEAYPETKSWLDQFLELPTNERGYYGIPGNLAPTAADCYVCPIGNDYTWYREANEEIPLCPTHLVPLVLAPT
ncbi:hypothetical protein N836_25870 [Leptolyngbya sp. Heron Island J]|uniref:hypothetical protein n=1 Tax=Leptolyngbya sp. Heron Island J TaxID=1385935 RepID=UPI0003B97CBD|nr:hypothetical protein [Leptolyngbya sp. Heron Island J]ESA32437.1 hypothetical protein N836_25870 [Leptolyngbya sp. Heron Island J]